VTTVDTSFDEGLSLVPVHVPVSTPRETELSRSNPDLHQEIKNLISGELGHIQSDVEFRLEQTRALENRMLSVLAQFERLMGGEELPDNVIQLPERTLYAEDVNTLAHAVTGYTFTSNSPGAGSVAWASLSVVYNGVTYAITNGNSNLKFIWFDAAVSTTVLQASNTKPTLAGNACLLIVNDAGIVREVLNATMPPVVANSAIDNGALQTDAVTGSKILNGTITAAKTDFAASFASDITAALSAAALAQATADGAISSYFQETAPWANGTVQPAATTGDVWYKASTGVGYRWSGPAGSPTANLWVEIVDAATNAALAAAQAAQTTANGKITTFYAAAGSPPSATTIGDLWIVTDQGNQTRRATAVGTASWVTIQLGTNALADGAVVNTKLGTDIQGSKIVDGTLNGLKVTNGTLGATKLNTLQHQII
jgi:hypothetical protein